MNTSIDSNKMEKVKDPKQLRISLFLTEEELEALMAIKDKHNITATNYVNQLVKHVLKK